MDSCPFCRAPRNRHTGVRNVAIYTCGTWRYTRKLTGVIHKGANCCIKTEPATTQVPPPLYKSLQALFQKKLTKKDIERAFYMLCLTYRGGESERAEMEAQDWLRIATDPKSWAYFIETWPEKAKELEMTK